MCCSFTTSSKDLKALRYQKIAYFMFECKLIFCPNLSSFMLLFFGVLFITGIQLVLYYYCCCCCFFLCVIFLKIKQLEKEFKKGKTFSIFNWVVCILFYQYLTSWFKKFFRNMYFFLLILLCSYTVVVSFVRHFVFFFSSLSC